jgi:restriction system protein
MRRIIKLFEVILFLVAIGLSVYLISFYYRNKIEKIELKAQHLDIAVQNMKLTLSMGLYYRYKKENRDILKALTDPNAAKPQISQTFLRVLKEPSDFEEFAANVMERAYGGKAIKTGDSGDFGVDIEHWRGDELYLGQVKCYQKDLAFDPIAIIHSQMVKQNAKGGFIVTTSNFSDNAREYAAGLGIELIDGVRLVELWIRAVRAQEVETEKVVPQPAMT